MSMTINPIFTDIAPKLAAFLKVDADPAATRLSVINRFNLLNVHSQLLIGETIIGLILPQSYSVDPILSCIIFDDNLINDAKIVDHVQAQLIDLSNFNLADA